MNNTSDEHNDAPTAQRKKEERAETVLDQDVVIITSFMGDDPERMRRNILDCMRLKYIIENHTTITWRLMNLPIQFHVSVAYTEQGDVNTNAFKKIINSDVLIAVVSDANVNVIYELAVRSLIKPEHLILIKNADEQILPKYLQSMGYISFDSKIEPSVQHEIDKIARNEFSDLAWSDLDGSQYPSAFDDLKSEIDRGKDETLQKELQNNLHKLYQKPSEWPNFMADLALQIDPAGLLDAWSTYYPTSLVRVQWSGRLGRSYKVEEMAGAPVVIAGNPRFCQLYGIKDVGDPNDGATALTASESLAKLKQFMAEDDYSAFEQDQQEISKRS